MKPKRPRFRFRTPGEVERMRKLLAATAFLLRGRLTIQQVADEIGLSPNALTRWVCSHLDKTLAVYLRAQNKFVMTPPQTGETRKTRK